MPRSGQQTRERILENAYRQFRRKGYTRVSMDSIAAASRVTKRTLYYHFESKDTLLASVLEAQHQLALAAFKTFGDQLSGSPLGIIEGLFHDLVAWADTPRWAGSGFTRLVVELADLPGHPARRIARRHKAMLEAHFADVLERAGVALPLERAREIWLLSEGAISLMLVHGDRRYALAAAVAAKKLLKASIS
nr:TetR/AcrR family transcriptional regulator [Bradyrhizobium sp. Tv2a-2]